MKTFKILGLALFAAALTVGFVSCGSDEDDEIVINTKDEKPIDDVLKRPVGSLKGTDDAATVIKTITAKDSKCPIKEFMLTKGKGVIALPLEFPTKVASRAYTPTVVLEGTYETDGTMIYISIPGYDKVFTVDSKDVLTSIIFGDTGFGAEVKDLAEPTEILDQSICRAWTKPTYQAVVMFDGLCAFNKTNNSFFTLQHQMLDALNNKKDVKLDLLKEEIKGMKFYTNGTAHVIYSNNETEVVTWNWQDKAKGVMNMTINGNKVTVDVRFKEGNPNEATFVISGDFSALGSGGVHTITGRLIVTMKN